MLPLLLMLLQDPSALPAPVFEPDMRLRVTVCGPQGFQRIERPIAGRPSLRPDLTYRQDGEVRRYLLLHRTVRGCPAPISYAVPAGQNGFIRELGRTPPPVRFQPPRSSE